MNNEHFYTLLKIVTAFSLGSILLILGILIQNYELHRYTVCMADSLLFGECGNLEPSLFWLFLTLSAIVALGYGLFLVLNGLKQK